MIASTQSGKAAHLRSLVEKKLKRPVNERVWWWLEKRGKLDSYVGMSEAELVREGHLEEIVELYRDFEHFYRAVGAHIEAPVSVSADPSADSRAVELSQDGSVLGRAQAFSRFVAALARHEREVDRFREQVLGGRLLDEGEARRFLESPALALLSLETLLRSSLPRPPLEIDSLLTVESEADGDRMRFSLTGGGISVEMRVSREAWKLLAYPGEDGRLAHVRAAPGSVLGHLQKVGSRLARRYPWQEAEAVWFVLTGVPPFVSPATWRVSCRATPLFTRAVLTLEVEPWVPPKAVMEGYRRIQERLGIRKGVGAKAVALVDFLAQQVRVHQTDMELPSWSELMALWNEAHPEWKYEDLRHFARDCKAALDRVVMRPDLLSRMREL